MIANLNLIQALNNSFNIDTSINGVLNSYTALPANNLYINNTHTSEMLQNLARGIPFNQESINILPAQNTTSSFVNQYLSINKNNSTNILDELINNSHNHSNNVQQKIPVNNTTTNPIDNTGNINNQTTASTQTNTTTRQTVTEKTLFQGTDDSDVLYGDNLDNILNGGLGADSLTGMAGNDTYIVDNSNDRVYENANEGIDTVQAFVSHYLDYNVENLEFMGTENINGFGNTLDNIITGNNADNKIYAGQGDDNVSGKGGSDFLFGYDGNDKLNGGHGDDFIYGESGNDTINGNEGNDYLYGNSGNDILTGGTGNDYLSGTAGDDTYYFNKGDGSDILIDNDSSQVNNDVVKFNDGINKADIALFKNNNDLIVGYGGTDQITIKSQFETNYGIEKLELADGNFLTGEDINKIVQNITTFADASGLELAGIEQVQNNTELMNLIANGWS